MIDSQNRSFSRRDFLAGISTVGAAALLGFPRTAAAEPPPEMKKIRLVKVPAICLAPEYLAEELLRLEGFAEVEYVSVEQTGNPDLLLDNRADISADAPPHLLPCLDVGKPSSRWLDCTAVATSSSPTNASGHPGPEGQARCRQSWKRWSTITVASIVAYVGMDPRKDIDWVVAKHVRRSDAALRRRQSDAFLGISRRNRRNCAREKIGRVIVEHGAGPAVVPVLLLHALCVAGLRRAESCRDEAGSAGDPEGRRHLCARSPSVPLATWSKRATSLATRWRSKS